MQNILLVVLGILVNLECDLTSEIYPSIHWVPENPLFSKECSVELKVRQASKVNFVCPNPSTVLETRRRTIHHANMYENMLIVDNESMYNNCNATNGSSVFECNKPSVLHFTSVAFNPNTADAGLSFLPGKTYYFLATSDGTEAHINDRVGGRCSSHAMKFEVYVCNDTDPPCDKGIGVLQCKSSLDQSTASSLSTSTSTLEPSSTPAPSSVLEPCSMQAPSSGLALITTSGCPGLEGQAQKRKAVDDDAEMKKWRTIAFVFFAVAVFAVGAFLFVIYKFIKRGKASDICFFDMSSNKIKHNSGEGYKNQALDCDFEDGKSIFNQYDGDVQNSDKKPNGVCENKAVISVQTAPDDKTDADQVPNGVTVTNSGRNVPQDNSLSLAT